MPRSGAAIRLEAPPLSSTIAMSSLRIPVVSSPIRSAAVNECRPGSGWSPCSAVTVAYGDGLSSGATTAMLDRLENSGLIERKPNPNDRRGTLITLAKAGAERVAPWFASARQAQNELVATYSEEQLQLLLDFFEKTTAMWEGERRKLQGAKAEQ